VGGDRGGGINAGSGSTVLSRTLNVQRSTHNAQ
jgi:hypothetical protein